MNRIGYIDNARAICMLWIVGFWHMMSYWNKVLFDANIIAVFQIITWIFLSLFTYLSGYFMSRYVFKHKQDVVLFYKRRFKRFYLLYVLSCTTLLIAGISLHKLGKGSYWFGDGISYLLSLVGLGTFYPNPPSTLWFFSMLICFYLITPLLRWNKSLVCMGMVSFIALSLMCISLSWGGDLRNIQYFPFYIMGLLNCINLNKMGARIPIICFVGLFLSIIIQVKYGFWNNIIIIMLLSLLGLVIVLFLFKVTQNTQIDKILFPISFASMNAYLFHRQICGLFKIIIPIEYVSPILTTIIYLPVIFLVSFYMQKIYDKFIK